MVASRVILFGVGSTSDEPDDEDLIQALRRGDPQAAFVAWRRFAPLVTRTLRRLMGPGCDEEDLGQEVFLRFFRNVPALRTPSAVRSFLLGICIRVVRQEVRRRWLRRWLHLTDRGSLPEVAGPDADHDAREVVRRYYDILDRVGAEGRSLFVTRHIEGVGLADVAALHGLSVSTTQRKLARVTERVAAMAQRDPVLAEYVRQRLAAAGGQP
jgi:RNA polymerase sigma-70 factor (ECF subfamily)